MTPLEIAYSVVCFGSYLGFLAYNNRSAPQIMLSLEQQISQLESIRANHRANMLTWLSYYLGFQCALLGGVFSAQLPEGSTVARFPGWRWTPLILSCLASVAMTVVLLQYLVEQLSLFQRGLQILEQQRPQYDLETGNTLTIGNQLLFSNYSRRNVKIWLLQKAASLGVFIANLCLLVVFVHTPSLLTGLCPLFHGLNSASLQGTRYSVLGGRTNHFSKFKAVLGTRRENKSL